MKDLVIIITTLLLGTTLSNCNFFDNESKLIFDLVFADGGRKNPKIIFQKQIHLSENSIPENIYIIRNGNEEILAVLDSSNKIAFIKIFTLMNIGPIEYSVEEKKWIPTSANLNVTNELYIIKNLEFKKIAYDSYFSIFLEILSEEPPFELFSVPLVYRNFQLEFDGFTLFKETSLLKELNRVPASYIPESNGIRVLSTNPPFDQFYYFEK